MKEYHHYVPVLRLKASELDGLSKLALGTKNHVTPLIEVIPNNNEDTTFSKYILARLKRMTEVCCDIAIYVDLTHIHAKQSEYEMTLNALEEIFSTGELKYVPVVTLKTPKSIAASFLRATQSGRNVAIRVKISEIDATTFTKDLLDLISTNKAIVSNIHFILDCELIDGQLPDLKLIASKLPDLSQYHRFILVSGSFPKDLSGFKLGVSNQARKDWALWKLVFSTRPFKRTPIYGDYAIQHPFYSAPPKNANVSASIRYTADDYWVILRGESLRNEKGPKHKQYAAHATILTSMPEYSGSSFCYGDAHINNTMIERKTTGSVKKPGTPRTWLAVGFNHHISFVVNQLSRIP